ncbi:hypothetical protein Syun_012085 [Stephania yunnanensis]|uniref:Uncharacterized protein n=1 Tax=Stephania yunnanensis TaxID=152371 RepID=A0AAP0JZS8_9MAGN
MTILFPNHTQFCIIVVLFRDASFLGFVPRGLASKSFTTCTVSLDFSTTIAITIH